VSWRISSMITLSYSASALPQAKNADCVSSVTLKNKQ
jgi:hypothetical protein